MLTINDVDYSVLKQCENICEHFLKNLCNAWYFQSLQLSVRIYKLIWDFWEFIDNSIHDKKANECQLMILNENITIM